MAANIIKKPKAVKLRRAPKQERGVESRDKILNGAQSILTEEGFSKFSMRRISVASGVGLSTIYDYFPSKSSVLQTLLEERLKLRLQIFDRTIEANAHRVKLREFIDSYIESMKKEGFWSHYDVALTKAAQEDNDLKELLNWYDAETIDRYVRALKVAGSKWSDSDLKTVAVYLLSIWAQFGPDLESLNTSADRELMEVLVRETFSIVLRKVLSSPKDGVRSKTESKL